MPNRIIGWRAWESFTAFCSAIAAIAAAVAGFQSADAARQAVIVGQRQERAAYASQAYSKQVDLIGQLDVETNDHDETMRVFFERLGAGANQIERGNIFRDHQKYASDIRRAVAQLRMSSPIVWHKYLDQIDEATVEAARTIFTLTNEIQKDHPYYFNRDKYQPNRLRTAINDLIGRALPYLANGCNLSETETAECPSR
jgi:hypothetical protein